MKDAVAHKRCNSAEPADRKADFSGATLARPTIRGMGHVNRKSPGKPYRSPLDWTPRLATFTVRKQAGALVFALL
jgi:hypothetical protein